MLVEYILEHTTRGACTCGRCFDAPENPEEKQPGGHTVDLTFFKVSAAGGDKDEFIALVKAEHPGWLDGKEHNYIAVGGDIGDQGTALMAIGLGHLLGAWKALSPDTVAPFLGTDTKQKMAGAGMVSLKADVDDAS